jgi:hypothetical protein
VEHVVSTREESLLLFRETSQPVAIWPNMNQHEASADGAEPASDSKDLREEDALAATQIGMTATRSKLENLMSGFTTFDDVMRIGTRARTSVELL